jgi:hypothetical protein
MRAFKRKPIPRQDCIDINILLKGEKSYSYLCSAPALQYDFDLQNLIDTPCPIDLFKTSIDITTFTGDR